MRIAILTRRAGYNMGSSLQAYAMLKLFSKFGENVKILNYDEYANHLLWKVKPTINKLLFAIFKILPFLRILFKSKYCDLNRMFSQQKKFKQFESTYMHLTTKRFHSSSDLCKTNGLYDAYICGSDQIWSPKMFEPAYYLDFVKKAYSKKIAYAPSMGVTEPDQISEEAKKLIRDFDYISCREKEGSAVLSAIVNKAVTTVLDPTLMLEKEDWEQIIPKPRMIKEKYILTYFLHTQFFENNIPNKFIKKLQEKTGYTIVNIQMHNMLQVVEADLHLYECGPLEFLNLIKNAEYIVTNSFHCCVFSFLFERKFFVSPRFRKGDIKDNQNPRIYTLLETINNPDALLTNEDCDICLDKEQVIKDPSLFIARKNESFNYIQNSLKS